MKVLYPLIAVLLLVVAALVGAQLPACRLVIGVAVPYAAIALFLAGFVRHVFRWAQSPVPFRIPTTCGQQRSLSWIKSSRLDNPNTAAGVIGRMALEILLFRSLFRNSKVELRTGPRLTYGEEKWLWLGAMAFHWSFFVIFLRHLRFFVEPVPAFVIGLGDVDGFFQVGAPVVYLTGLVALAALVYLLYRRVVDPRIRYISLPADYFPLYLLSGLMLTGILMRYFTRVDVMAIKQFAMGLVTFSPVIPDGIGALFFAHLTLVSVLIAYFPFSKLMHMPGIFLSPTRNLANNSRAERHVNPWDYPVHVHTYAEWEEEFRDKIVAAGLPLDKE